MKSLLAACLLLGTGCAAPPPAARPVRPLSTFSIVARDEETGELGVAVQSHWFSVGTVVTWAEAGVGAVATHSIANPAFGPQGLALMRTGTSAPAALRALLASDEHAGLRQVALVDASGQVAAHTGERCIPWAGHEIGPGFSVQANIMENEGVVPAMARAYAEARGALAERLLAALEAAQREGGDLRGMQSAALLVVGPEASGRPWEERRVDLRVEDHPQPIEELKRLYRIHQAYQHMNAGDRALERDDLPQALAEYARAAERYPDNAEVVFWNAFTLATNGRLEEAVPLFKRTFRSDSRWVELLRRLPASELCAPEDVQAILERCGVR
jgi:uncharacterized Ntn-hydrolase superfamily protein